MTRFLPFSFSTLNKPLATIFSCVGLSLAFSAQADVIVDINIDKPEHHLSRISLSFEPSDQKQVVLELPVWRTGRYEILNIANGVRHFSATDEQGQLLNWHKTAKDTWVIENTTGQVNVSYQLYANQLAKRTRHIDDSHAFLDASAVVMYSKASRDEKHIINLTVPAGWKSVSGLPFGEHEHQFIAPNYDVLVDSPIETGVLKHHEFKVDGRDYELAIWGDGNYVEKDMIRDLKKLVKTGYAIWPDYPYERYVFMVHATSGARGATEHLNSTIIQRNRYSFNKREDYLSFLSTASHEFVHTWNVKQYRPEGLVPYDYQHENYSNLLWLSEGSTSYFQNQLLARADIMTTQEFLRDLAKRVNGYLRKPGRDSQSIADASFDKWIDQGGDYGKNHSVNIYSEGYLTSWLLDFAIIEDTRMKKSYRDVHSALYQEFRLPKSFNDQDVLAILKDLTGNSYESWWQENVEGTPTPDFDKLLKKAGLKMSYGSKDKAKPWTGMSTQAVQSGLKVTAVEKNSPAWQAGFTLDDIIIAIDGLRMADTSLDKRLDNFAPEQEVVISFFRRDKLMEKTVRLGALPAGNLTIVPVDKPSKRQKQFFKAWTGVSFPKS
ncbi:M61 family metallopeptidase [Thalassotalea sp. LPB0316]|uniref:M61 family metallopeptidase n=1 Tax=Thalassotalea sp. LPB0316 TaxID=2769490 RepID=UPI001867F6CD|nr:PDZ domain-containing protein [Thalassotalea sp. LPB0316]QOL24537.1 M61 family metallopeptidase [Thalassotalea sp. LPB0316]